MDRKELVQRLIANHGELIREFLDRNNFKNLKWGNQELIKRKFFNHDWQQMYGHTNPDSILVCFKDEDGFYGVKLEEGNLFVYYCRDFDSFPRIIFSCYSYDEDWTKFLIEKFGTEYIAYMERYMVNMMMDQIRTDIRLAEENVMKLSRMLWECYKEVNE